MSAGIPIVVVTRPSPDHEPLLDRLRARGLDSVHSPAVERIAEDLSTRRSRMESIGDSDIVVVVSPFAARLLLDTVAPTAFSQARFITPGAGTGRLLADAGRTVWWPETGGTSEDLLAGSAFDAVRGARVGIVGAPGGRRLIDDELRRRGASVRRVDLYRRFPCRPRDALLRALASDRHVVVLVSSTGAFEGLSGGLEPDLVERWVASTFVVSSERVAEACRAAGAERIVRAGGASDRAMLAAVDGLRLQGASGIRR